MTAAERESKQVHQKITESYKINPGGSGGAILKRKVSLRPAWSGGHASTIIFGDMYHLL